MMKPRAPRRAALWAALGVACLVAGAEKPSTVPSKGIRDAASLDKPPKAAPSPLVLPADEIDDAELYGEDTSTAATAVDAELEVEEAETGDEGAGDSEATLSAPLNLHAISRLAMSKLAPLRRRVAAVLAPLPVAGGALGAPAGSTSEEVDATSDGEDVSSPQSTSSSMMMMIAVAVRVGLSLLMFYFSSRRRAANAAGGDGAAPTASLFSPLAGLGAAIKSGPLGPLVLLVEQGVSKFLVFARSPSAGPVMMVLLIFAVRLVKSLDAPPEQLEATSTAAVEGSGEAEAEAELLEAEAEEGEVTADELAGAELEIEEEEDAEGSAWDEQE